MRNSIRAKAPSHISFKQALKLSLVLFISLSFILQTNATKPLAETLYASDTLGASVAWDPDTHVLTIQGDCDVSDIKNEIENEASSAQEMCFSGNLTITTDTAAGDSPFARATNLERITALGDTQVHFTEPPWEASPIFNNFFSGCSNLKSLDGLASWDVSNVTGWSSMEGMFYGCSKLTSLDALATWNVSNQSGDYCMRNMFYGCSDLKDIKGIASWNLSNAKASNSGVTDMFSGCSNITFIKGAPTDTAGFVPTSDMNIPTLVSSNNFYSEQAPTTPVPGNTLLTNWSTYASQGTWTWGQIVTFDANGGQNGPAPELVAYSSYATEPTSDQNPTKDGFSFDGWATDIAGTTRFDFAHTQLTTDTTLYAQWSPLPVYTVTFDTAGGSLEDTQYIVQGKTATRPAEDPIRVGYSFVDWYTDETGTTLFDFSSPILADTVVYAHWTAEPSPSDDPDDTVPEEDVPLPQTGDVIPASLLPFIFLVGIACFAAYASVRKKDC